MAKQKIESGEYNVESNIALPRKCMDRARFPFPKMKVGDSFFIPKKDQEPVKAKLSVYSAVTSFNKNNKSKIKCATRSVDGGVRVFRIK